jgi:hypothetical protein
MTSINIYRGADRRQRSADGRGDVRRVEMMGVAGALILIGVLVPSLLATITARSSALHLQAALRMISASFFLCSGVLNLVRWRVTGETRTGLRGGGTLCLGLFTLPASALGPLLHRSTTEIALAPIMRTVAVCACLSLLTRAILSPDVDSRVRPLRVLSWTVGVATTVIVGLTVLAHLRRLADPGAGAWSGIESAMAICWVLCALPPLIRGLRRRQATFVWMGSALLLMAGAETLRALSFVGHFDAQFYGTGIQLLVGTIALVNAAKDLAVVFSADGNHMLLLAGTVHDTQRRLSVEDEAASVRRHDARTVLASLKAASTVLERYDATLDVRKKAELRSSLTQELGRLENMIDGRPEQQLQAFRLDDVLTRPLASLGVPVAAELTPAWAMGRPDELIALLQSVVTTLGRRSPGQPVRIRTARTLGGVLVICEAEANPDTAGRPGGRTPDDDAVTQLRLQLARRLLREQHGELVVRERRDGCATVTMWLEAAPTELREDAVEAADVLDDDPEVAAAQEHPTRLTELARQQDHEICDSRRVVRDQDLRRRFLRRDQPEASCRQGDPQRVGEQPRLHVDCGSVRT